MVSLSSMAGKRVLTLDVNGDKADVAVPPHWTLLETLRYEMLLTGSKQGCDKGDCGACTVLIDGEPHLACLTLASKTVGKSVVTIEGLSKNGKLDPVQDAFDQCGALQCGFCQSGMMLAARNLIDEKPAPSREDIKVALSGNLCRCTGYTKIIQAVEEAARHEDDESESRDDKSATGS